MNKHIVVVSKEDTKEEYNNFDKLNFLSVYDVKDKSKKRLVYAKLNYEGNRLLVETDYLNLIEVDLSKNYFKVELNDTTMDILEKIDNRGVDLLDILLNNNDEIKEMNLDIQGEFSYITLIKFDNNEQKYYLRVRLCENTKIYLNNKEINKEEINQLQLDKDDMVRFLLEIDSINIYPQENICGLKNFCLFIDIKKKIDETIFSRAKLENYKFSSKKVNNKIILEDFDLSYLKTDVSPKSDDEKNIIEEVKFEDNVEKLEDTNIFVSTEKTKKPTNKRKPQNKKSLS
jgi:hypothetical protein